jgi:CrcB protein
MEVNNFLLVGAGGAIGSMLRYGMALATGNRMFPYATFAVNIAGCFIIGVLLGLTMKNSLSNYGWKFLATGLCGGFTTFSAMSLEAFELLQQQRYLIFILYILLSITIGLAATYSGYVIAK